jgi:UDP-N-acetylmuramoyl-tripeptide--D-alanyl-D-alanine ligase
MFKIKEILEATGVGLLQGNKETMFRGISLDSRTLKKGELFVALKGNNFDGHDFVSDAINKGAQGIVICRDIVPVVKSDFVIMQVKDTLAFLRDIARFQRLKFNIPVIAVTGSNGKTTVKEMIYEILSLNYRVLKTPANHNNQIGVSLTLLDLSPEYEMAVAEAGINHFGEMGVLRDILQPNIAVFTNIGSSHLEFLVSPEDVLKAKLELIEKFASGNQVTINADDYLLRREFLVKKKDFQILSFGIKEKADFQAKVINIDNRGLEFEVKGISFFVPVLGRHNIYNALAAIAVGSISGIALDRISQGLKHFHLPCMRMNIERLDDFTLIDDTYNSNPDSLKYAIETLINFRHQGRKILVCADMLELGRHSQSLHSQMGEFIARSRIDLLLTIGHYAKEISDRAVTANKHIKEVRRFLNNQEALVFLSEIIRPDDVVLVKGSRSMHLEEIVQGLRLRRNSHISV